MGNGIWSGISRETRNERGGRGRGGRGEMKSIPPSLAATVENVNQN